MSSQSCQVTHVNSFMSIPSFQFIHVDLFVSIHSCQFLHFNSFMSVHSWEFTRFHSCVPIPSFQVVMSIDSCQWIYFISFPFTFFQLTMNSYKQFFFETSASARSGHYLVQVANYLTKQDYIICHVPVLFIYQQFPLQYIIHCRIHDIIQDMIQYTPLFKRNNGPLQIYKWFSHVLTSIYLWDLITGGLEGIYFPAYTVHSPSRIFSVIVQYMCSPKQSLYVY